MRKRFILWGIMIMLVTSFLVGTGFGSEIKQVKAEETNVVSGECGAEGSNVVWSYDTTEKILTLSGEGVMADGSSWDRLYYDYKDEIKKIIIGEGITHVGEANFRQMNEEELVLPSTLESIGYMGFESNNFLKEINLPQGLKIIEDYAFHGCGNSIEQIEIPGAVESIGEEAFTDIYIKKLIVNEGVKTIGYRAFDFVGGDDKCIAYLPSTLENIDSRALERWNSGDGNLVIYGKNEVAYNTYKDSSFWYVDATQTYPIGEAEYYNEDYIVYPHGDDLVLLVSGEDYELSRDAERQQVFTGKGVYTGSLTRLNNACGTKNLGNSITWEYDESKGILTISGSGEMQNFDVGQVPWEKYSDNIKQLYFNGEITHISDFAFGWANYNLEMDEVQLPSSLETIGECAFGCDVKKLSIPGTVKEIVYQSFVNMFTLSTLVINEGTEVINENNFRHIGCSNVNELSIYLPSTLTTIAGNTFNSICAKGYVYGKNEIAEDLAYDLGYVYIDATQELSVADATVDVLVKPEGNVHMYEGVSVEPELDVTYMYEGAEISLKEGTDYEVVYTNANELGTATATVKGIGVYSGEKTYKYEIKNPMEKMTVTLEKTKYVYDGQPKTPAVTVTYLGKTFVENTDYIVTYSNHTEEGTATVLVKGIGNNCGSQSKTFTISKNSIADAQISLSETSYTYDGTEKKPDITVKYSGVLLKEGIDYKLVYGDTISAGESAVTVMGMGVYGGTKQAIYEILPVSLTTAEISLKETIYTYDGSPKVPSVVVSVGTTLLISGTDYNLSYKDNIDDGTAFAVVTGVGNYTDIVEMSFVILPYNPGMDAVYESGMLIDEGGVYGIMDDEEKEVEYCCPAKKNISKVQIPATVECDGVEYKVTSIGEKAFYKNTKITSLVIGNNVTSIENYAFYGCKNLKTIKCGKNIEIIGDSAFRKCTKLISITLPKSLDQLGKNCFYGCKKLKTITINTNSVVDIKSKAFKGISNKATFKVPKKLVKKYKKELGSKTGFKKTMTINKK